MGQLLQDAAPGRATIVGDIVVMKRLIFEVQTSMVALSRAQADPSEDPNTAEIPAAERAHRPETQKRRLVGLDLQGPLEVAHQVYDLINGMLEADAIKYLAPSKCIACKRSLQQNLRRSCAWTPVDRASSSRTLNLSKRVQGTRSWT